MRHSIWVWAAPLAAVLGALVVYTYFERERALDEALVPAAAVDEPLPSEAVSPEIVRPATSLPEPLASLPPPEPDPAITLPPLDESDDIVRDSLTADIGAAPVEQYVRPRRLVRHFVATLDNLPNDKIALQRLPIRETPGAFIASGTPDEPVLDEANFARYTPFVQVIGELDPQMLVATYHRLYPLLQQAYQELGYPSGEFNTRTLEVIEHLLSAPAVEGPIPLEQARVLYTFADPELEGLSAGQKVLVRIGPQNAAIVKAKLRELRAQLIAQAPRGPEAVSAVRAPELPEQR